MTDPTPDRLSADRFVDPSPIEPQTDANQPDNGTKLFVLFFFLIVPALGIVLLAAMCWTLWKAINA
jgi:hypothetical protein